MTPPQLLPSDKSDTIIKMTSVMAIGSGLISGRTNTPNDFTVYTNGGGYGGLSIAVDGPSKAEIRYADQHDGSVKVVYTPHVPGEYKLTVRYNGYNVKGSPYTIRIRGDESPRDHCSSVISPSWKSNDPHSRYGGGITKVRVSGRGLYSGVRNVQNEIKIDVRDAGTGRLHWSIEGPGNVESKNRGLEDGVYRLYYRPETAGEYKIKIMYNDVEVLGSPFRVRVS